MAGPQADGPELDFILSRGDGRPMYLQIIDLIQQRVAVGDWAPGVKLPSIRELAVAARVSVITVKRAYLELERSGVIVTQQGKGSWVREHDAGEPVRHDELERLLESAAALAVTLGVPAGELRALLERYLRD